MCLKSLRRRGIIWERGHAGGRIKDERGGGWRRSRRTHGLASLRRAAACMLCSVPAATWPRTSCSCTATCSAGPPCWWSVSTQSRLAGVHSARFNSPQGRIPRLRANVRADCWARRSHLALGMPRTGGGHAQLQRFPAVHPVLGRGAGLLPRQPYRPHALDALAAGFLPFARDGGAFHPLLDHTPTVENTPLQRSAYSGIGSGYLGRRKCRITPHWETAGLV